MNRDSIFLGSVSAVAVAATGGAAFAADPYLPPGYVEAPKGITYSIEGGLLFGQNTVAADKLGDWPPFFIEEGETGVVIQDNIGGRAAISLGTQLDANWDVRGTLALNHLLPSTSEFWAFEREEFFEGEDKVGFWEQSISGQLVTQFSYETLDLEAGYSHLLGEGAQARFFAGVRGLHFTDSTDKMGTSSTFSGEFDEGWDLAFGFASFRSTVHSEFIGAGPRIGVEGSARLGDSNLGVSGLVSAAAIYGVQRTNATSEIAGSDSDGDSFGPFVSSESDEEFKFVYNLEGTLGLDYYLNDQTKVTLGYRGEALFNVQNSFTEEYDNGTRFVHGPTIKLTGSFN